MIYLMQLFKRIDDLKYFQALFTDIDFEELGYEDDKQELINEMLLEHYGFSIIEDKQLDSITNVILRVKSFNAAIVIEQMRRAA